jgi:hypothetical protein
MPEKLVKSLKIATFDYILLSLVDSQLGAYSRSFTFVITCERTGIVKLD